MWEAGFGSLYWMEGVVVRLQDRRGGTGQVCYATGCKRDGNDGMSQCVCTAGTEWAMSCPGMQAGPWVATSCMPKGFKQVRGTTQVLNVLRVNNDNFCDLAALTILDDR